MARHAYHWDRDIMCAVDTETTGLDPEFSEVVQVAIVPLDNRYRVDKTVMPLNLLIRPDHPERINLREVPWGRPLYQRIMDNGLDSIAAIDAIEDWYDEHLSPPYNKYGNIRGKIIPLGHNYPFDLAHLKKFLGWHTYENLFSYQYRDTMTRALQLNDTCAAKGESVPFSKVNLRWLCKQLRIDLEHAHDALYDSIATAEVYRRMLYMDTGLLG